MSDGKNAFARNAPFKMEGVAFDGRGEHGDFKWMVKQPVYDHCAFIITENYIDMMREDSVAGGGTACLRPYTMYHLADQTPLRAMSVPTGWSGDTGGFPDLDTDSKTLIDLSIQRMFILLETDLAHVTTVYYSCDKDNTDMIGTGIFAKTLHPDVVDYISRQLVNLPKYTKPVCLHTKNLPSIRAMELTFLRTALLIDAAAQEEIRRRIATAAAARKSALRNEQAGGDDLKKHLMLKHGLNPNAMVMPWHI